MPFAFFDHTGDIGFTLTAGSPAGLFEEGAAALIAAIADPALVEPRVVEAVELEAPDLDQLLVDWLSELIVRFETREFLVHSTRVRLVHAAGRGPWKLAARLEGERFDPARHRVKVLVKAVTWHGLVVEEQPAGAWTARVILDI